MKLGLNVFSQGCLWECVGGVIKVWFQDLSIGIIWEFITNEELEVRRDFLNQRLFFDEVFR